jgi:TRAP-type C4-dicarboxylate transport system permease small subunit
LDRALGFVSALPLALIIVLTFTDVFARYVFAHPIPGASEMIQFAMAMTIFTALPLVTRAGGHITVDLFTYALNKRKQIFLQLPCELLSGLALAIIAWRLWVQAQEYAESQTASIVLGLHSAPLAYAMALLAALSVAVVGLRFIAALRLALTPSEVLQ